MAKIMVVEDNDVHRKLTCAILQDDDHEVIEASNGEEALGKLKNGVKVELVILDERMPMKTGLECLESIRGMEEEAIKNIPVIFLTVVRKPEIETRKDIMVIHKPYDYKEFLRAVRATLSQRIEKSQKV